MDTIYRLYTEDLQRQKIYNTVSKYFLGFNVRTLQGYYKGTQEQALVIELVSTASMSHVVRFLAKVIGQMNKQECVMVTAQSIKAELV